MRVSLAPKLLDASIIDPCSLNMNIQFPKMQGLPRVVPKKQKSSFLENGSDTLWVAEQFKSNLVKGNSTIIYKLSLLQAVEAHRVARG
jgi:hypothetical protein